MESTIPGQPTSSSPQTDMVQNSGGGVQPFGKYWKDLAYISANRQRWYVYVVEALSTFHPFWEDLSYSQKVLYCPIKEIPPVDGTISNEKEPTNALLCHCCYYFLFSVSSFILLWLEDVDELFLKHLDYADRIWLLFSRLIGHGQMALDFEKSCPQSRAEDKQNQDSQSIQSYQVYLSQ